MKPRHPFLVADVSDSPLRDPARQASHGYIDVTDFGRVGMSVLVGDVEHRTSATSTKSPTYAGRRAVPGYISPAQDKSVQRYGCPGNKRRPSRKPARLAVAMAQRLKRRFELKTDLSAETLSIYALGRHGYLQAASCRRVCDTRALPGRRLANARLFVLRFPGERPTRRAIASCLPILTRSSNTETAASSLVVIANGIPSEVVSVTVR